MRMAVLLAVYSLALSSAFALAGFGVFGPVSLDTVNPALSLTAPNGGESWRAGSTKNIRWIASDNHFGLFPIQLYYSVNGDPFTSLCVPVANTGTHSWRLPWLTSNTALVQIVALDRFGNSASAQSAAFFSILATAPRAPEGLTIAVLNDTDVFLSWFPVVENEDGSSVVPDGYQVLFYSDPFNPDDYILLGDCTEICFTHENAALDWERGFYRVVAYTENSPELLSGAEQHNPLASEKEEEQ